MFIRIEKDIERPFEELEPIFSSPGHLWVPELEYDPDGGSIRVFSGLGTGTISKRVYMYCSEAIVREGRAVISLRVTATGPNGLFPELDADLELKATGPASSLLVLSGTNRLPLGAVGEALDRHFLHGFRNRALRNFMNEVAERLSASSVAA